MTSLNNILDKVYLSHSLSKDEIILLLKSDGKELCKTADKIRQETIGDEVHLRGLIEFSNICKLTSTLLNTCELKSKFEEILRKQNLN